MRSLQFLTILLLLIVKSVTAQTDIKNYINQKFSNTLVVSDAQIAQLTWAFEHDNPTNDLNTKVKDSKYIEVDRALTRLYCAQLLRTGNRAAYNKFVQAQIENGVSEPLTFNSFNKLTKYLQAPSAEDFSLLESATILPAVSLSKSAALFAQRFMTNKIMPHDNMDSIAQALRNSIDIYPITKEILQHNENAKKMLYILFPPQTNFRHMFYTEGGIAMFKYLRMMLLHGFIDKRGLELWYAYWLTNLAGYRGHINQHGSIYLTEPVMQAADKLRDLIFTMLDTPNFDPLLPYLQYRAMILGLEHLPEPEKIFLGHLGALLRLYDPISGAKLYMAVKNLPLQQKQALQVYFAKSLEDANILTPTHMPAFFANALEFTSGDVEQVINKLLPICNYILQQHLRRDIHTRLSFHKLSAGSNVKYLLQHSNTCKKELKIKADGEIILIAK